MDSKEFLQEQADRNTRMHRRALAVCVFLCVLWIPIAFLMYVPSSFFEDEESVGNDAGGVSTAEPVALAERVF